MKQKSEARPPSRQQVQLRRDVWLKVKEICHQVNVANLQAERPEVDLWEVTSELVALGIKARQEAEQTEHRE